MGMSEDSDVENGEAKELGVPDMNHLKLSDMEPRRSIDNWGGDVSVESESSSDSDKECEKIRNIKWCDCGKKCQPMETHTESICYQDTNEIPEDLFAGKPTHYKHINE